MPRVREKHSSQLRVRVQSALERIEFGGVEERMLAHHQPQGRGHLTGFLQHPLGNLPLLLYVTSIFSICSCFVSAYPISSIFKQAPAVSVTGETVQGREPERLVQSDGLMNAGRFLLPRLLRLKKILCGHFMSVPGIVHILYFSSDGRISQVKVISPLEIGKYWLSILHIAISNTQEMLKPPHSNM